MGERVEVVLVSPPGGTELPTGTRGWATFESTAEFIRKRLSSAKPYLLAVSYEPGPGDDWASVAPILGLDADNLPTGLDLIPAVRRRHPLGLLMPLCLIASREELSDRDWIAYEQTHGSLSPTVLLRPDSDDVAKFLEELGERWIRIVEELSGNGSMAFEEGADLEEVSPRSLPVLMVDDESDALTINEENLKRAWSRAKKPDREVHKFKTLKSAGDAILKGEFRNKAFILILDHDMGEEKVDEDLLKSLELEEGWLKETAFGWLLARQIRLHHPLGLAMPVAYYSGNDRMTAAGAWESQEQNEKGISPTAFWSKETSVGDVVGAMDREAESSFALLDRALFNALVAAAGRVSASEEEEA